MKKRNFAQLVLIVFTLISVNVWAGNEESNSSSYKISPDLSFVPNSDFRKSWEIAYGESKAPVQVLLKETKKGQEYTVRSSYFEVKYVNGEAGFGVRMVSPADRTVVESLNSAVINSNAMSTQKCISTQAIGSDQVLEMIASYLPDLINEQYRSILE